MRLFLGAYGADMQGQATGIGVLHAGAVDSPLASGPLGVGPDAVAAMSPSWIAWHPSLDVLYAALEGAGTVQAYLRTGEERFVPLAAPAAVGSAVCHVAPSPDGAMLLASCWGDGRVVRLPLDADGRLGRASIAPEVVDPYGPVVDPVEPDADEVAAAREALRAAVGEEYDELLGGSPPRPSSERSETKRAETDRPSHAHQAVFLPGGLAATTDMGRDVVRLWRVTGDGLRLVQTVVLPKGSGPRHMVWHPSGHLYVVTELSREVFALAADAAGTWRIAGGAPLAPGAPDTDTAAEIALSRDGEFVVSALRGSNTLAVLRVGGDGAGFAPVALADSGVDWPRHHLIERDAIVVAGQRSDEVVSLGFDERTGIPSRVRHRTTTPSPTRLLPDRA